jgi:hypothetical protein
MEKQVKLTNKITAITVLSLCLFLFPCGINVIFAQASSIQWQKCLGGGYDDEALSIQQTNDSGFIVAGYTMSNNGNVSGNHGNFDYWVVKLNYLGNIQWQKCLGGTGDDYATSIQQTNDNGFIVAGYTESNNGDVSGNHGGYDCWVVKLDSYGDTLWTKCLGGTEWDYATSIQQTNDSGFIVAGYTKSNDGDVSGNHGDYDYWVVKLGSLGDIQWQKCLGGTNTDFAYSIQQTSDEGFIVAGETYSNNGDVSVNHGYTDFWVVKLNSLGTIQWQKCLGGSNIDGASSIQQTSDEGFIVAGTTHSNDGDVSGNHGGYDYWIVKLDSYGYIQWQKCLGGTNPDLAYSIQQTSDEGFIVAGYTQSYDCNVFGNHGYYDYWVVKLDSSGDIQWQKCLGGSNIDCASSIQQTSDEGFIVAGTTHSNDGDVSGNHGGYDYWIVKLDSYGYIQWQKCLGGTNPDLAYSIQQTSDEGFIVAGYTQSYDCNVFGNHGYYDYWVVKLDSSGDIQWQKCLGGSNIDCASSIQQTSDEGFIVAGYAYSNNGDVSGNHGSFDYWVVKLIINTETDILSYSFPQQTDNAVIDNINHTVDIEVEYGTDLSSLIATFTLSPGATAYIGSVLQQSGVTTNDFTNPVTYNIIAEDGVTNQDWIVTVSINNLVENKDINKLNIYPNPASDIVIIENAENSKISIINMLGQVVFSQTLINNNIKLNVSQIPNGTYLIRIENNNEVITKKLNVIR